MTSHGSVWRRPAVSLTKYRSAKKWHLTKRKKAARFKKNSKRAAEVNRSEKNKETRSRPMPQSLRFDKASWRLENRRFSFSKGSLSVTALLSTNLGATPLLGRGKVRDLYVVDGALLLVATDRISAFDFVLGSGIPGKGKILTQISLFWFELLSDIVPNHLIATEIDKFPALLWPYRDQLEGRSMLVK